MKKYLLQTCVILRQFTQIVAVSISLLSVCLVITAQAKGKTRVLVIGDSLAVELWKGFQKGYKHNRHYTFLKSAKVSTGLMRRDVFNWNKNIRRISKHRNFDIAVIVLGGNDPQSIWHKGRRLRRGSKRWYGEYRRRLRDFMHTLRKTGKPVYWVGLPVVRLSKSASYYRRFNSMFRKYASANGFRYIDTWRAFATPKGRYTSYGRDKNGVRRRVRNNDGLHFNSYGRLKLARIVLNQIRNH